MDKTNVNKKNIINIYETNQKKPSSINETKSITRAN